MKRIIFLTALIPLFIYSCSNIAPSELTAEQKVTIEEEIGERYNQLISAITEINVDLWSEYWSEEGFISVSSGVNYFPELKQFVDSVSYWFSERERQEVESIKIDVTVLNSEFAVLTHKSYWSIWLKNGNYLKLNAVDSHLWIKEEDAWRIIQMHESWEIMD